MNLTQDKFLKASENPIEDISKIAYAGQEMTRRMYRTGYEPLFNEMPILDPEDPFLDAKVELSHQIMAKMAVSLNKSPWVREMEPKVGGFKRTILALAAPTVTPEGSLKEGPEFVLALWGDGHTSPVHGHAIGYLHEDIIFGKMRVNTYRMVTPTEAIVRPVETQMVGAGTFASLYTKPGKQFFKRQTLVHNFTSIGFSASLHYLSEHTRDGRDNKFEVQYFDDSYNMDVNDVEQVTAQQGMYLRKGDVAIVRSMNVPEYGDHYIVVTGHPVIKEHGMRPQDRAIYAPDAMKILDIHEPHNGLILLKMKDKVRDKFHEFHGIRMVDGEVVFPDPSSFVY